MGRGEKFEKDFRKGVIFINESKTIIKEFTYSAMWDELWYLHGISER